MESYPIMLNIKGKDAVVVGGGQIAYRKIVSLIQAGASVTVVSPKLHANVEKLFIDKQISWRNKEFEPTDLEATWIVIAATNSREVNAFVASSAGNHQLVNVVDNQELGNFQVPAKLSRGKLTISVATEGASPGLSKVICNELGEIYDDSYEQYLSFLAVAREKVKHSNLSKKTKTKLLKTITNEEYRKSKDKQRAFLELFGRNEGCV
ncbi:NAD(P)-binding protein [Oceanobacillus caeni]|uniref:NAD(P)-binding protein n=1 Tax=Oceanobacillus TaxID=182709 RepID=UPI00195668F6|nr:NAD(P)-binding protein [Oceanobacillus caeni]MCR1835540.1 NAD(P)-binding protein [Oceanobacillus caeni]